MVIYLLCQMCCVCSALCPWEEEKKGKKTHNKRGDVNFNTLLGSFALFSAHLHAVTVARERGGGGLGTEYQIKTAPNVSSDSHTMQMVTPSGVNPV